MVLCLSGGGRERAITAGGAAGVGWTLLQSLWALLRRVAGLGPSREGSAILLESPGRRAPPRPRHL